MSDLAELDSVLGKGSMQKVTDYINTQKILKDNAKRVEYAKQQVVDSLVTGGMKQDKAMDLVFEDIVSSSSGNRMSFPYTTPSRTVASAETALFALEVSDKEITDTYERNPFAKPLVDGVVNKGLKNGFEVIDPTETSNEIDLEFQEIYERHKTALSNAFKLARKDGYSLLFFKYGDAKNLHTSVNVSEKFDTVEAFMKDWISEINYKKVEDVEVFPVQIESYKVDTSKVWIDAKEGALSSSRVIQIRTPGLKLKKEGVSVLLNAYDSLVVAKHVSWGAGQGFWRSGQPQTWITAPPRATTPQMESMDAAVRDLDARKAFVMPFGTEVKFGTPTALDPLKYQDAAVREISASSEIPKGKLIGSQPGEMASATADSQAYLELIVDWQVNIATPILKKFFKRFIDSGQLDYKGSFKIVWGSPEILTEIDRSNIKWREALIEQKRIQTGQLTPDEARKINYPDKEPLTDEERERLLLVLKRSAL